MLQMNVDAVEPIRAQRTMLAAHGVVGSKHEVIDDQLATTFKDVGERLNAIRPLKLIFLLDSYSRKASANGEALDWPSSLPQPSWLAPRLFRHDARLRPERPAAGPLWLQRCHPAQDYAFAALGI